MLPADVALTLRDRGFVVLPGLVPPNRVGSLAHAYAAAVSSASTADVRIGTTSTRVSDFVNRGEEFDAIYLFPPLLEACCQIIGGSFKLSSFVARTLRPGAPAQDLHVDVQRDSADWPIVGFILMVDDFRPDNGATQFVPGSHKWADNEELVVSEPRAEGDGRALALGPAGSLLIFNGSTWHGHTANTSDRPRRSLQGHFIPRDGQAATDFAARMGPETYVRLSPLARHVLAL